MYCYRGKVAIPILEETVEPLKTLFTGETDESRIESQPQLLQMYFMGDDDAETHRQYQIILVHEFKSALENMPNNSCKVVIHTERVPGGQHPRRNMAPAAHISEKYRVVEVWKLNTPPRRHCRRQCQPKYFAMVVKLLPVIKEY